MVLVARRRLTAEEEARLFAGLVERFGPDFNFRTAYVDSIPRTAGGKFAVFRSEIPDNR